MLEEDLVAAFNAINDPELGISIVDLGLVYRAERTRDGIRVAMTLTTPSCPMSTMLLEEARTALHQRFPDTPAWVELVWDPPWSPARISDAARQQLGWGPANHAEKPAFEKPAFSWRSFFFPNRTRH
jgi:metal-sulfur cluster biosynthetic enzyme